MTLTIELDREADGRFIAEVLELPGVMAYGPTEAAVIASVKALAFRALAERLEHGELGADSDAIAFSERHAAERVAGDEGGARLSSAPADWLDSEAAVGLAQDAHARSLA